MELKENTFEYQKKLNVKYGTVCGRQQDILVGLVDAHHLIPRTQNIVCLWPPMGIIAKKNMNNLLHMIAHSALYR